jgi:hypothetical protein
MSHRIRIRGGYAIAAGTFGCVFLPALACEGQSRLPNTVSKLMSQEDADAEYRETDLIRLLLTVMPPASKDSFIVPLAPPCKPAPFDSGDLDHAPQVCTNFPYAERADLAAAAATHAYRILNQKDGGFSLSSLRLCSEDADFEHINTGILNLLPVVREMNLRGVIHGDLKDSNLVYNPADGKVRIIDWGFVHYLSTFYEVADHQEFMFNAMPSTIFYKSAKGLRVPGLIPPVIPRAQVFDLARSLLTDYLRDSETGEPHGGVISEVFQRCNRAREALGMRPIQYPSTGPPMKEMSQEATDIFIAHVVRVIDVVLFANGTMEQRLQKFNEMVDSIFRANQDIYGVLISYACDSGRPSAKHTYMLATVAPYLMDAKYAVEPYDLDQIRADFGRLNGPVPITVVDRFTDSNPFFSYDLSIRKIDPTGSRGFPASRVPVADNAAEMLASGARLLGKGVKETGAKRVRRG